MKKQRASGYYWVKYKDKWECAEWVYDFNCWLLAGLSITFRSLDFTQIIEKRIPEPKTK